MIDLNVVGAHPELTPAARWQVRFGIYLPGITPQKGYALKVRVIHENDQFVRSIQPEEFDLTWVSGSEYDLWQTTIAMVPKPAGSFGQNGRYLYRYQLFRDNDPIVFWFADPFGRDAGIGTLSAFTIDPVAGPFLWGDDAFKVPHVDDMVAYELHAGEFNRTFEGIEKQLDYLWDLSVNTLEIMPFTNVKEDVEWGLYAAGIFCS